MLNRITRRLAVRLTLLMADQARRLRRAPDAGMETVDKIMWAAATILIVAAVSGIFRDKLKALANILSFNLGW